MNYFFPDEYIGSAYSVSPSALKEKGIKGVLFDIDNTLAPYSVLYSNEKAEAFLSALEAVGITVGFISNNDSQRVEKFNDRGRFYISKANKPSAKGVRLFAEKFGLKLSEIAIIGDQIFTDVICARNAGAYSILVVPIDKTNEPWYFIFKRAGEKILLSIYRRKYGKQS